MKRTQTAQLNLKLKAKQTELDKVKKELEERKKQYYNNFNIDLMQRLDNIFNLETQREMHQGDIGYWKIQLETESLTALKKRELEALIKKAQRQMQSANFQTLAAKENFMLFLKHKKEPFNKIWKDFNEHFDKITERFNKEVKEVIK